MKISVILPAFNEEEMIEKSLSDLNDRLSRDFPGDYEILVVNDGSKDRTGKLAEGLRLPAVSVIQEKENHGKGYAVRRGVLFAKGEYIFFTDCDLAYGTGYFLPAVAAMEKSAAELLVGSRKKDKEGFRGYGVCRRLLSRLYFRFLSLLGGVPVGDTQAGFKGFRQDAAKELFSLSVCDGFAFDYEILRLAADSGKKIEEFPIAVQNNRPSSIHFVRDSVKMIRDVLKIKRRLKKQKCKEKHTKKAV